MQCLSAWADSVLVEERHPEILHDVRTEQRAMLHDIPPDAMSVELRPRMDGCRTINSNSLPWDSPRPPIVGSQDTTDRRTANVQPLRDFSGAQPLGPELLHLRLINGWLPAFSPSQVVLMHAMIDDDNGSAWHEPVVGGPGVPVPHVLAGDLRKRWLHRRWYPDRYSN
jgi:hypothetical protein